MHARQALTSPSVEDGQQVDDEQQAKAHYRKAQRCRVLTPLPSAIYRTLGKDTLCRVPALKHSAKSRHSAKPPLPSARHSAKT